MKGDWICPACAPSDTTAKCRIARNSPKSTTKEVIKSRVKTPTKHTLSIVQKDNHKSSDDQCSNSWQSTPLPKRKCDSGRDALLEEESNQELKHGTKPIYEVGTIVQVEDRTWVGSNKPGGVAKIIDVHIDENEAGHVSYDVQYVLESRKEFDIDALFISIDNSVVPGFASPAGGTRSSRSRESRRSN